MALSFDFLSLQPPAASPAVLAQVRREQIESLYRNLLFGMMPTWVAAGVLVLLLAEQHVVDVLTLQLWFALISALTLARMGLAFIYRRRPEHLREWRGWAHWFTAGAIASGLGWGVGSLFLMTPGRFDLQLLIVLILLALVCGALASFGRWMPAFFGFFLPAMLPSTVWSLLQPDMSHVAYGALACIWIPSMAWLAFRFHGDSVHVLSLGYENAALSADLRQQKEVADNANAAKSRFLAAASHDLRQPVHALGLFVGALKSEKLDPAAAHLVDQIDTATGSLDEMFTALLDVSRLDAGVLQPELRSVALKPLLMRIAGEMEPAARAKGLELRIHALDVRVTSDPVMIERIARNLLANALRYTERGGVLAAVRCANGQASIEVWDTGPGIPDHLRDLVFREFYQGDPQSSAGGLGLGLAIVQRLCALLQHKLELRSKAGRGSMFRVRAPLASAAEARSAEPEYAEIAPQRAMRIWIVEDDAGPRAGMQALLTTWGHEVAAAASGDAMLAAYETDPRAPHLILCDYRLGGEDGVRVVERLRARLGAQVPAALITGETGPGHLLEARASGLPILHKPVPRARLRALIGNLTRTEIPA